MMENSNEREINIIDLFIVLRKNIFKIIAVGMIAAIISFAYTNLFVKPVYRSSAKMVIKVMSAESITTYSDVQIAVGLVNDCVEIIQSRQIMQKVIDKLDLDYTTDQLLGCISISVPVDTRVLKISVNNPDPQLAKKIADKLCETTEECAGDYIGVDSIKTFETPSTPIAPVSPNVFKNTVFGGIIGVILSSAFFILISLLNNKICTPDDAEQALNLTVFSAIPYTGDDAKHGKDKKTLTGKKQNEKDGGDM